MKLLLDDRLAPITSQLGFLKTGLHTAVDGFIRWLEPIQKRRGVRLETRPVSGPLGQMLRALEPLTSVEATATDLREYSLEEVHGELE